MSWKQQPELTTKQLIEKLEERLAMKWPQYKAHGNPNHMFERELPKGSVVRFTLDGDYTSGGAVNTGDDHWYMQDVAITGFFTLKDVKRHMDLQKYEWSHIQ